MSSVDGSSISEEDPAALMARRLRCMERAAESRVEDVERSVRTVAGEVRALRAEIGRIPTHIDTLRLEVAAMVQAARDDVAALREKQDELEGDSVAVVECLRHEVATQAARITAADERIDSVTGERHPARLVRVEEETRATQHTALSRRIEALEKKAGEDLRSQRDALQELDARLQKLTDGKSVEQMRAEEEKRFFVVWDLKKQMDVFERDYASRLHRCEEDVVAAAASGGDAAAQAVAAAHAVMQGFRAEVKAEMRALVQDAATSNGGGGTKLATAATTATAESGSQQRDRLEPLERAVDELRSTSRSDMAAVLRKVYDLERSCASKTQTPKGTQEDASKEDMAAVDSTALESLEARIESELASKFDALLSMISPLFDTFKRNMDLELSKQRENMELYVDERLQTALLGHEA